MLLKKKEEGQSKKGKRRLRECIGKKLATAKNQESILDLSLLPSLQSLFIMRMCVQGEEHGTGVRCSTT